MRVLGAAGLFLLGAVVAVSGTAVSLLTVRLAGVSWPIGLIFVLVVTGLCFRLGGQLLGRTGAFAAVAGWVLAIAGLLWPRPEGDVLIPASWSGIVFLGGGVAVATWTLGRSILRRDDEPRADVRT